MLSNRRLVNILSMSLAAILIALAIAMTLIAIFLPGGLDGGFDFSGYDPNHDGMGQLPGGDGFDLNGNPILDGDGDGGGGGGGGGGIDMSRVVFRVFSAEDNDKVYFRQGSYVRSKGSEWFEAEPFKSKNYPYIDTTYFTGQYILMSSYAYEKSMAIESLDGTLVMPYYPTSGIELPETVYPNEKENFQYSVNYVEYSDIIIPAYDMAEFVIEYEEYAKNTYLELTPDTEEYMQRIIKEQHFRKNSKTIVEDVAEYIKNSKKYDMNFDPALEEEENIPVAFLEEYESGVCRHFAASATMLYRALGIPARYTVGFLGSTNAETWTDVTVAQAHAWVEIFVEGIGWQPVEVTPPMDPPTPPAELIPIEIKPVDIETLGNESTVLTCNKIEGFEYYEAQGYRYEVEISGEQRGYGKSVTTVKDIRIYNENNEDVTSHFKIKAKEGTLHVYFSELTFYSKNTTHVYSGEPIRHDHKNEYAVDEYNSYYGDHTVYASFLTYPVDVGTVANVFVVELQNENGDDITDHYKLTYKYGEIEVVHAEIAIKAMDAEKMYDGEALECHAYEFIENNLAAGHYIDDGLISIVGSQTERGRSENVIDINSIVIRDRYGRDVTSNYKIKTYTGQLRVR